MSKSGTSIQYKYDGDGLRTEKTVNGKTTIYSYTGSRLTLLMTEDEGNLYIRYDGNGEVIGLRRGGQEYTYVKNLQGDILGIANPAGEVVVLYNYDAYGRCLVVTGSMAETLGQLNPLRYRGYVYDNETGYYYLQSRYYDPEMGRFLNADNQLELQSSLLGGNMFAYCANNPVNASDPTGHAWWHWRLRRR